MKSFKHFYALLFLISVGNVFSQKESTINLIVKDNNSTPIPNALILFDDIKQVQKTNSKGIFTIDCKKVPKKITAFSPYHGIKTIKYDGKKYNRIIISKNKPNLSIITPSNVIAKKIENSFKYSNIYQYIRGEVPGVNVNGEKITIRGTNTVNGSSTPLFILNQLQINQDTLEDIALGDIKHIKVLKGPETALYGLRGANGVIEITTY